MTEYSTAGARSGSELVVVLLAGRHPRRAPGSDESRHHDFPAAKKGWRA